MFRPLDPLVRDSVAAEDQRELAARGLTRPADLRLVEVNQRTVDNLTKIIGSLENVAATAEPGENDAC